MWLVLNISIQLLLGPSGEPLSRPASLGCPQATPSLRALLRPPNSTPLSSLSSRLRQPSSIQRTSRGFRVHNNHSESSHVPAPLLAQLGSRKNTILLALPGSTYPRNLRAPAAPPRPGVSLAHSRLRPSSTIPRCSAGCQPGPHLGHLRYAMAAGTTLKLLRASTIPPAWTGSTNLHSHSVYLASLEQAMGCWTFSRGLPFPTIPSPWSGRRTSRGPYSHSQPSGQALISLIHSQFRHLCLQLATTSVSATIPRSVHASV